MKKFILPLLSTLLLCTSCLTEDSFTMSNVADYVTASSGKMVNDYRQSYTVVENAGAGDSWRQEGKRFFIEFDILNRSLDIRLNKATESIIPEVLTWQESLEQPNDPVRVLDHSISGGYLNLVLAVYAAKERTPLGSSVGYYAQPSENQLIIHMMYDGQGENPAKMEPEKLQAVRLVYSVPLAGLFSADEYYGLCLSFYELVQQEDGIIKLEKNTYQVYPRSY